jgi:hypothetical protein
MEESAATSLSSRVEPVATGPAAAARDGGVPAIDVDAGISGSG